MCMCGSGSVKPSCGGLLDVLRAAGLDHVAVSS